MKTNSMWISIIKHYMYQEIHLARHRGSSYLGVHVIKKLEKPYCRY